MMNYHLYIDDETKQSHLEKHKVTIEEIYEFFEDIKYIEFTRKDGSIQAYGKMKNDRYLIVAYRKIDENNIFIITSYDLEDKEIIAILDSKENQ